MRNGVGLAFGAAIVASSFFLTPVTATALPLGAGASSSAQVSNPLIEQVQARRVGAGRAVAGRGFAVRGGGGPRYVGRRGGGIGAGGAAAIGLGILGVAAAAAAANAQPQYYEPAPSCYRERQPVYDRFGNYRGDRLVRVCQ